MNLCLDNRAETAHACAKTHNVEPSCSLQETPNLGNTPYFLPRALNSWVIISKSLSVQTFPYLRLVNDVILRSFYSIIYIIMQRAGLELSIALLQHPLHASSYWQTILLGAYTGQSDALLDDKWSIWVWMAILNLFSCNVVLQWI